MSLAKQLAYSFHKSEIGPKLMCLDFHLFNETGEQALHIWFIFGSSYQTITKYALLNYIGRNRIGNKIYNSLFDTRLKYNSLYDPENFLLPYLTPTQTFHAFHDTAIYFAVKYYLKRLIYPCVPRTVCI
jgi:hypothetical protein